MRKKSLENHEDMAVIAKSRGSMQTLLSQTMKAGIKDTRGSTGMVPGELGDLMSLKMGNSVMMPR